MDNDPTLEGQGTDPMFKKLLVTGARRQRPGTGDQRRAGRQFRGMHGNGELTAEGESNVEDVQPLDGVMAFGGRGARTASAQD
ncbi:MAG: hypothetical protein QNJ40_12865 [Xanthomonadales bacterium]|nr:hypothetical protein [Xanthomonadales bacterium]